MGCGAPKGEANLVTRSISVFGLRSPEERIPSHLAVLSEDLTAL